MMILIFILVFTQYSEASFYPPTTEQLSSYLDQKDLNRKPSSNSKAINLALNYIKATKQSPSQKSCLYFKSLENNNKIAFHDFIPIKVLESCQFNKTSLKSFYNKYKNIIPTWTKKLFLDLILKKTKKIHDPQLKSELYYELSFYSPTKKDKESYLLKAKKLTRNSKLKNKIRKRLIKVAPRFKRKITKKDYYEVARNYDQKRKFTKARKYYRKIINNSSFSLKDQYKAWVKIAMTYKKSRKSQDYVKSLKNLGLFLKKKINTDSSALKLFEENQIALARGIWTLHQRDKAKIILKKLVSNKGISPETMAIVYWLKGSMKMEEKEFKGAIKYFEEASEFNHKNEDINSKIMWALAWNAYQGNNFKKASQYFDKGARIIENLSVKRRFYFWLAKALAKSKQHLRANRILHEILKDSPFSYYGILASKELMLPFSPIQTPKKDFLVNEMPLFSWLYVLGEKTTAKNYLIYYLKKNKVDKDIVPFLKYFSHVGAYSEGIKAFYQINPEKREDLIERELELLYPSPYRDMVSKISAKHGLSPAIIYSITRQESAFNPHARSWADAFGLMQLTPETAKVLASDSQKKLQLPYQLFEPELNISLGTKLFKRLKKKFNNNYILAIASYNASQRVVKRWYKERFEEDPIEFIEKIPYQETRNYVKLVLRNYIIYKRVLSHDKFYFPEEIISTEQS
ncbi:MAG: transglycosylase SLT domain-containing protein [Bacteriovoracaceae bacterium]